jgi:hypothetical protein
LTAKTVNPQTRQNYQSNIFGAAFRAGILGGLAVALLLIVYQLSFTFTPALGSLMRWLVPPVIAFVWVVTGIGAVMIMGGRIKASREGGKVGGVAGIVAGVVGGVAAMIIAALGFTFVQYGQGLVGQFSTTQLEAFTNAGFSQAVLILIGSVFSAMFACGFGGMALAGLFGAIGGAIFPPFAR